MMHANQNNDKKNEIPECLELPRLKATIESIPFDVLENEIFTRIFVSDVYALSHTSKLFAAYVTVCLTSGSGWRWSCSACTASVKFPQKNSSCCTFTKCAAAVGCCNTNRTLWDICYTESQRRRSSSAYIRRW